MDSLHLNIEMHRPLWLGAVKNNSEKKKKPHVSTCDLVVMVANVKHDTGCKT